MSLCLSLLIWLSAAWSVLGSEVMLDQDRKNSQRCSGMYSKQSWGGSVDPYIDIKFLGQPGSSAIASLIIYEFKDFSLIGRPDPKNTDNILYKCDQRTINLEYCDELQMGQYLLAVNATEKSRNIISTTAVPLGDPKPMKYEIKQTGYYCVATEFAAGEGNYNVVVEFRNAYGELPAAQIAKLPFYGAMTLVYAVMGIFWGFLYAQNRFDVLPVQNYITAIIVFLVAEMMITWGYYDFENVHGITPGSKVFLGIVAVLNAARNAFSFFLLLIVCMGYGVVKPSLGKTMTYVRILGLVHFFFCILYTVTSMVVHPEETGFLVLFIVLPLSITLTVFYVWTLNSLNLTMKDLDARKQHVKAAMYKKLFYLILATILTIFAFFFLNSLSFASVGEEDFAPSHWQTRWFVLDGWLNIVYLADVAVISYIWRPTPNNRRFAMSDEIAQDDDGFEIHSFGGSQADSDDEYNIGLKVHDTPPGSGPGSSSTANETSPANGRPSHRDISPLPAPQPRRPSSIPEAPPESEDMFGVGGGDDDDEDEDAHERKEHHEGERLYKGQ